MPSQARRPGLRRHNLVLDTESSTRTDDLTDTRDIDDSTDRAVAHVQVRRLNRQFLGDTAVAGLRHDHRQLGLPSHVAVAQRMRNAFASAFDREADGDLVTHVLVQGVNNLAPETIAQRTGISIHHEVAVDVRVTADDDLRHRRSTAADRFVRSLEAGLDICTVDDVTNDVEQQRRHIRHAVSRSERSELLRHVDRLMCEERGQQVVADTEFRTVRDVLFVRTLRVRFQNLEVVQQLVDRIVRGLDVGRSDQASQVGRVVRIAGIDRTRDGERRTQRHRIEVREVVRVQQLAALTTVRVRTEAVEFEAQTSSTIEDRRDRLEDRTVNRQSHAILVAHGRNRDRRAHEVRVTELLVDRTMHFEAQADGVVDIGREQLGGRSVHELGVGSNRQVVRAEVDLQRTVVTLRSSVRGSGLKTTGQERNDFRIRTGGIDELQVDLFQTDSGIDGVGSIHQAGLQQTVSLRQRHQFELLVEGERSGHDGFAAQIDFFGSHQGRVDELVLGLVTIDGHQLGLVVAQDFGVDDGLDDVAQTHVVQRARDLALEFVVDFDQANRDRESDLVIRDDDSRVVGFGEDGLARSEQVVGHRVLRDGLVVAFVVGFERRLLVVGIRGTFEHVVAFGANRSVEHAEVLGRRNAGTNIALQELHRVGRDQGGVGRSNFLREADRHAQILAFNAQRFQSSSGLFGIGSDRVNGIEDAFSGFVQRVQFLNTDRFHGHRMATQVLTAVNDRGDAGSDLIDDLAESARVGGRLDIFLLVLENGHILFLHLKELRCILLSDMS